MRALLGLLSLVYGVILASVFAFTLYTQWLPMPLRMVTSETMMLVAVTILVGLVAISIGMAAGGGAMLLGRRWSVRLLNRAATGVVLALFCYYSLGLLVEVLRETDEPIGVGLMRGWGLAFSAAAIPLLVVWWTGRNISVPVERLTWTWQQNQRRGRRMAGQCHRCGAWLNFASGEGVGRPEEEPFKLVCAQCASELTLTDVS